MSRLARITVEKDMAASTRPWVCINPQKPASPVRKQQNRIDRK